MKLSEFPDALWRQISREEHDLERKVLKATISIRLETGTKEIQLHKWDYTAKEIINEKD